MLNPGCIRRSSRSHAFWGKGEGMVGRAAHDRRRTRQAGNSRSCRAQKKKAALRAAQVTDFIGVPKGSRTPVTAVKGRCPRPLDDGDLIFGGARRDRTVDLYNAIVALSQLSYGPTAELTKIVS
jgi:hypothetical protein